MTKADPIPKPVQGQIVQHFNDLSEGFAHGTNPVVQIHAQIKYWKFDFNR